MSCRKGPVAPTFSGLKGVSCFKLPLSSLLEGAVVDRGVATILSPVTLHPALLMRVRDTVRASHKNWRVRSPKNWFLEVFSESPLRARTLNKPCLHAPLLANVD